jgi:TolB-like protein/Flp pilus assembly protein TadD
LVGSERAKSGVAAEKPVDASPAASPTKVASIAVLPFVNMSGDAENEYFSDGLAEELLNALARNPALRVAARTSSFSFKGKDTEIAEIGRRLNVATVLEGSVRKAGNRVRITVQLVSATDGYHIWSETYDRQLEDIFAVQDDIARSVMTSLKAALPDAGAAAAQRTGNTEAYNLVLRGDYFWRRTAPGDLQKARDLYKQALALDPDNARAWQQLGLAYGSLTEAGELSREDGLTLASDALERALALDDSLPNAHAMLGWQKLQFEWDWAGAETELGKALALGPPEAGTLSLAAAIANVQGRLTESNEIWRQMREIDPLAPVIFHNSAVGLLQEGRLEEAMSTARTVLELSPQRGGAHQLIGRIYLAQAKPDEALQEYLQETTEVSRLYGLVMAYHALGRRDESDASLASWSEKYRDKWPGSTACLHAFRGELDEAFVWLERAYAERDRELTWVKVDPDLENLRGDPRWLPFLRKMRLAD